MILWTVVPRRSSGRTKKPISIMYRADMKTPMTKLGGERNPITVLNKNCSRRDCYGKIGCSRSEAKRQLEGGNNIGGISNNKNRCNSSKETTVSWISTLKGWRQQWRGRINPWR
jgi:hypothetical protein